MLLLNATTEMQAGYDLFNTYFGYASLGVRAMISAESTEFILMLMNKVHCASKMDDGLHVSKPFYTLSPWMK
jgi:hypothetical protein